VTNNLLASDKAALTAIRNFGAAFEIYIFGLPKPHPLSVSASCFQQFESFFLSLHCQIASITMSDTEAVPVEQTKNNKRFRKEKRKFVLSWILRLLL
jgi:hypothetical protein